MVSRPIPGSVRIIWDRRGREAVSIWGSFVEIFTEHDWSGIEDIMVMDSDVMENQDK